MITQSHAETPLTGLRKSTIKPRREVSTSANLLTGTLRRNVLPPLESRELTTCEVLTPGKPWSSTMCAKQQVSYGSDSEGLLHSWSMKCGVDFPWV